jgi:D-lactate dehydrogenase
MWREVARLRAKDALGEAAEWEKAFDELGTDLCATDGLCLTRCPLRVDVAGFVRDRRADRATDGQKRLARSVGNHFAGGTRSMSLLLDGLAFFQRLLGDAVLAGGAGVARKVSGGRLPAWNASMPRGAGRVRAPQGPQGGDRVVYVPSCAARTMGDTVHDPGDDLPTVTIRVLERAGYTVVIPANIDKLCCGKAFETKGLFEEADAMSREMEAALLTASENGALPILCDTSPCLARMRKVMDERLKMYEPVEFALAFLTDRLTLHRLPRRVAVHPTCSMRLLGLAEPFVELAGRCAEEVVWPKDIQCCGFSGDKGFTHPELNAAALATLRGQVADCDAGYSTSRTCEIGLSLHGGISYKNVMYLLDESSTPR